MMIIKIDPSKKINLAQLTGELLPLGVTSLVHDAGKSEIMVKAFTGNPTEAAIKAKINAHVPKKILTRKEIIDLPHGNQGERIDRIEKLLGIF